MLFWLCLQPFILSGVISLLISSSISGTHWPGEFSFQCPIFLPFYTVHGFSRQEYWSGLPFPSPVDHVLSENTLVIANTLFQKHKRFYTWTSPDGQHWNQTDYILCSQRWRSSIQSAKTRLGADCGSDHELLIVKFRLKLKKVGKTTRPFRYDLNQIPYDYTVEVIRVLVANTLAT